MKTQGRFEETKIKMVMKLRGVSRAEAIAVINGNASSGKTPEKSAEGVGNAVSRGSESILDDDDGDLIMSAAEFFGER